VLEALGVVHHSCIDCVALVIDAGIIEGGEGDGRRWMQKEGCLVYMCVMLKPIRIATTQDVRACPQSERGSSIDASELW